MAQEKYNSIYGWQEWVTIICRETNHTEDYILNEWSEVQFLNRIARYKSKYSFQ